MTQLRCWVIGPREPDLMSTFCLQTRGHKGSHTFVRDHAADEDPGNPHRKKLRVYTAAEVLRMCPSCHEVDPNPSCQVCGGTT